MKFMQGLVVATIALIIAGAILSPTKTLKAVIDGYDAVVESVVKSRQKRAYDNRKFDPEVVAFNDALRERGLKDMTYAIYRPNMLKQGGVRLELREDKFGTIKFIRETEHPVSCIIDLTVSHALGYDGSQDGLHPVRLDNQRYDQDFADAIAEGDEYVAASIPTRGSPEYNGNPTKTVYMGVEMTYLADLISAGWVGLLTSTLHRPNFSGGVTVELIYEYVGGNKDQLGFDLSPYIPSSADESRRALDRWLNIDNWRLRTAYVRPDPYFNCSSSIQGLGEFSLLPLRWGSSVHISKRTIVSPERFMLSQNYFQQCLVSEVADRDGRISERTALKPRGKKYPWYLDTSSCPCSFREVYTPNDRCEGESVLGRSSTEDQREAVERMRAGDHGQQVRSFPVPSAPWNHP